MSLFDSLPVVSSSVVGLLGLFISGMLVSIGSAGVDDRVRTARKAVCFLIGNVCFSS